MGNLNSRERVHLALEHQEADRVPLDLGGSPVSGMHVSTVYRLRQALRLDPPGRPVKVLEPYQMLGEIEPDLVEALGVDVVSLSAPTTFFGFRNEGWKTWELFDGTPVLVPAGFNTDPEPNGDLLMYPGGDNTIPPSGRMPRGGQYFDSIMRQPPADETTLMVDDNLEEFTLLTDAEVEYYRGEADRLFTHTDKAIFLTPAGIGLGDIAQVPAPWLKYPRGVRDVEQWYRITVTHPELVIGIFERQCEIALFNLAKLHQAIGERIAVVWVSGTDFGMQTGPLISPQSYRRLYKPFHTRLNRWIHEQTTWKTFIHSCGSVTAFLEDFIEAGFDVLNPLQFSAARMDPAQLKTTFGSRVSFWGGGVDTQHTLPFASPAEVRQEVRQRLRILGPGGGFVFNTIHNVQPMVPVENLLAMYETLQQHGQYPLRN